MTRNRLSTLLATAVVFVALVVGASPASGAPIDEVYQTILQARALNNEILNEFTTLALSASTADELKSYRVQADNSLEDVYWASMAQLDGIEAENPDLASEISQARSIITNDHNAAHAEVSSIYQEVLQGLLGGTTTTTTVPKTTTTTTAPRPTTTTTTVPKTTTTTTTVPTSTTTTTVVRPTTTTTTVPDTTTTTTRPDDSTTTPTIGGGTGGDGTNGSGGTGTPGTDQPTATEPPPEETATVIAAPVSVSADDTVSLTDTDKGKEMRMERGMVSGMLESSASVVLPPTIARFTAAPFIVLEVLFSTLFESAQALLMPFLVLMATVAWFMWRETRRPTRAGA